ncbi:MAG: hypothetical protein ACOX7H_08085 [Bacillota bacterium]
MPKETFYNLSEEKRQRIFKAAVSEFALLNGIFDPDKRNAAPIGG